MQEREHRGVGGDIVKTTSMLLSQAYVTTA